MIDTTDIRYGNLLIYYDMGNRGNFLATILTDSATEVKFNHVDLKNVATNGYEKIHSLYQSIRHHTEYETCPFTIFGQPDPITSFDDIFRIANKLNATTIRILPRDIDDVINSAHLALLKNRGQYTFDELLGFCEFAIENLNEDLDYRHKFDYVVYFSELFDIDRIKNIYRDLRNKDIDELVVDSIVKNYQLQPILTKQENRVPELDATLNEIRLKYATNFN